MKQKQAHGHAKKHTGTAKHTTAKPKHHPAHQHAHHQPAKAHGAKTAHTKAKHPAHTKARALSLGDVSCCAADALAWSLRLSGWPVAPSDILALYKLTADSPDAGASILATLDAAYLFGLAGVRPLGFEAVTDLDDPRPLLLGVDLPGRHTVLSSGGWISWNHWYEPDDFPDAVIEEAWAVTWR